MQRKAEIESYHLLLIEIETWLRDLNLSEALVATDDEPNTIENIKVCQSDIKKLVEKQKTLAAIKAKCDSLNEYEDVKPLALALSEQLARTIEVIRLQLVRSNEKVHKLEAHLIELRKPITPTPSEDTLDSSSSMPEHIESLRVNEVETQTSESLQVLPKNVTTIESSVQTNKDLKATENICVTQTQSEGHETIKILSAPNPCTNSEYTEDVFVDARYKQPNEEQNKSTELVLRNVPQTSFETIFVEPDNTTTEVVVDADGRKQIIVRKVMRTTIQHQQVIEQKQQLTKISSVAGAENEPIEQNVSQTSTENQSVISTISDDKGSKTTKTIQSKISHAAGDSLDNLVVQAVLENPIITEEVMTPLQQQVPLESTTNTQLQQSCVQTVTHHLTQRIIRRKKKIIRRVTVIDGKEHVTEEVIEEPEEVEITEDHAPGVNINVELINIPGIQSPIIEMPPDEQSPQVEELQTVNDPVIISDSKTNDKRNEGKKVRAPKKVEEEENSQVFTAFEQPAPVVLVDNAHVVADLPITSVSDVNLVKLPAKTIEIDSAIDLKKNKLEDNIQTVDVKTEELIENINEIWPEYEPSQMTLSLHKNIQVTDTKVVEPQADDSIPSKEMWPFNEKTGHDIILETYEFEQQQLPPISTVSDLVQPTVVGPLLEEEIECTQQKIETEHETQVTLPKIECEATATIEISHESQPSHSDESSQKTYSIEKTKHKKKKNKKPQKFSSPETSVQMNEESKSIENFDQVPERTHSQKHEVEAVEEPSPVSQISKLDFEVVTAVETLQDQMIEHSTSPQSENLSETTYFIEEGKDTIEEDKKSDDKIRIDSVKPPSMENKKQAEDIEIVATKPAEKAIIEHEENINITETTRDVLTQPEQIDPVIVIEKCDTVSPSNEPKDNKSIPKPTTKTIDVLSATQLFIEHELNVSDGTTRTVKLTMSPKEPSSPGSVTVKMKLDSTEQPKLNVNLIEERLQSTQLIEPTEPIDRSVAESTELHISDDNTITDEMEMPEIEATPIPTDNSGQIKMSNEQVLSPAESYRSISDLEAPVKILEESVISTSSSSPKPLAAEVIIASQVLEEQHATDVEQQTDPTDQMIDVEHTIARKDVSSRSMQTTPEKEKVLVDEELQTTPVKQETADIEVQTSPDMMVSNVDIDDNIKDIEKTNEGVRIFYIKFNLIIVILIELISLFL